MIDFACQTVSLKDIITCSFGLSKTEYHLLITLLQNDEALTINDAALQAKLERSTVQKAMTKLKEKDLVIRKQINLRSGGYQFIYGSVEKSKLKKRLMSIVDGWHKNVDEAIAQW